MAWGKADLATGERHHLAHHSADVAAVLVTLLQLPVFRARAEKAAGHTIAPDMIACLGALAFLHDIGKLAPAFQVKAWFPPQTVTPRGHVQCGWLWLMNGAAETALAGNAPLIGRWPGIEMWFRALFAHHGRPVPVPNEHWGRDAFAPANGYDWKVSEGVMGAALIRWFPQIFYAAPPAPEPAFVHFFTGLLALADWIGSDRAAFPFVAEFNPDYWTRAVRQAQGRLASIGLDTRDVALRGPVNWGLLSDHPTPRPAQCVVADVDLTENLLILEAETGSGKTEAALWRFAQLYEAGQVDALYFAVPTRAAARQLQRRVNDALQRMFADPAPEAILAVPGQALAGDAQGKRLPDFKMLWDDTQDAKPSRWAAEHATRFLAAQIAVGTVDQVMMGGLEVKHAHLRGSALSRSLLVIDEVHASDAWMTAIQQSLVQSHLALGGHALLMSATLGAVARATWRGEPLPDYDTAWGQAYPVVWTATNSFPVTDAKVVEKIVSVQRHKGWSGADAAQIAIAAAQQGARVLVIRNTVDRARDTWAACRAAAPDLVFELNRIPTLHHSRFAAEDRAALDKRVEAVLGDGRGVRGVVVIGTQTLEQSLDIDADLLVTDLCPMDVLLQRIGRLHRHQRVRPYGFGAASAVVLCPEAGLDGLTQAPDNGLGAYGNTASLSGVYLDVPMLAATLAVIEDRPIWSIPAMNRELVERATHPAQLAQIAQENGWEAYQRRVTGKALAETKGAELVILDRSAELPECFPDDEVIRTRLGAGGAVLHLPDGVIGSFGHPIRTITLPAHWSRGLTGDEVVQVDVGSPMVLRVADRAFVYDESGLRPLKE